MAKNFYITTTAPYVNAEPHIGFALEIIQADVIARYHKSIGNDVFFNTGTDEHGKKIYEKAIESKENPQEYVNKYALKFNILKKALNLSYNSFQRTTSQKHIDAAQKLWEIVKKNGYIKKGRYHAKYCVGCELEKQDSELVNGKCPLHPNKDLELIEEENYFFKFSNLQKKLIDYYNKYSDFVIPSHRQKEIKNFVQSGLTDFSISRIKKKMPWGIPVPEDDEQVMYVWFDALTYYISALGWPENTEKFKKFWGTTKKPNAIQVAGKDNLRQQTAMWQAILLAANLPLSKQILIHGFITSNGQKMSKSLGNVINPIEYVEKYGADPLRYYLLAKINPTEDSDFTKEKFEEIYNSDLANGLGNLISRIAKLAERSGLDFYINIPEYRYSKKIKMQIEKYRFDEALKLVWQEISKLDQKINKEEPWKLEGDNLKYFLENAIKSIKKITYNLKPFLPETAEKIENIFTDTKIRIPKTPLFPRLKQ